VEIAAAERRSEEALPHVPLSFQESLSATTEHLVIQAEHRSEELLTDTAEHAFEKLAVDRRTVLVHERVTEPFASDDTKLEAGAFQPGADSQIGLAVHVVVPRIAWNPVEEGGDRAKGRALSRFVRPVDDMEPGRRGRQIEHAVRERTKRKERKLEDPQQRLLSRRLHDDQGAQISPLQWSVAH